MSSAGISTDAALLLSVYSKALTVSIEALWAENVLWCSCFSCLALRPTETNFSKKLSSSALTNAAAANYTLPKV